VQGREDGGNASPPTDVLSPTAPASEEASMPHPVPSALLDAAGPDRDRFRAAVAALPAGPLRDVLIAVAYARDAAARTGAGAAPDDRWRAVVAAAERAAEDATIEVTLRLVAAA
jgi:hypothetical protein